MKDRRKKLLERILAVWLAFLLVFNTLAVPVVWAQEAGEPPAEEASQEETAEQPSEPPAEDASTDTPPEESTGDDSSGGDGTITTGDAEAQATVETTANTHLVCLDGQVSTPESPCNPPEIEVETDCPEEAEIAHDNLATASATATSSATTGDNKIFGMAGDALIDTGDATAGASLENEINTNIVILEDGEEGGEEGGEDASLVVENENEVTATNSADVLADTGANQANGNGGSATIETGEALAYANLLNLLNTNIVGSDFQIYLLNLLEGQENGGNPESLEGRENDVNLHEAWQKLIESGQLEGLNLEGVEDWDSFLVLNINLATLENDVTVTAMSGDNEANQNQGDASVHTGDATALANVVNLVNFNLVGSQFFLGVINVFGSFFGNLVLPRPEKFISSSTSSPQVGSSSVVFSNQNSAETNDSVAATAETGGNQENNNQGDNFIQTGDATSQANAFSLLNTNIQFNNWFFLIINHLGSWTGKIFGWGAPEAIEEPNGNEPSVFQVGADSQGGEGSTEAEALTDEKGPDGVVSNQNQAQLKNKINVSASTGQNQANENGGDTEIVTGKARALANLFNLVNLNILGGRWFLGVVNIFGDWTGNTIFAYPDTIVALSNGSGQAMVGEKTEYTLSYQNQGYDEANEVVLKLQLPAGINYLGDNSGLTSEISGQTCSWFLDNLEVGESDAFTINVEIDSDFSFDSAQDESFDPSTPLRAGEPKLSFFSRMIPQAHAAENGAEKEVVAMASIGITDPESDLSNNQASVTTIVYSSLSTSTEGVDEGANETGETEESDGGDQRQPVLEISAWNNVGEYVYPGDIVTFEITITNTGEGTSYDTYLTQELFNSLPEEDFGAAGFEIGTLEPGEGGVLSFGLKLNGGVVLPQGNYHTEARAFGHAPNGNEVASNKARTDFKLKLRDIGDLFSARAKEEEILGAFCKTGDEKEDILPYILLFLLSSFWLVEKSKKLKSPRMVAGRTK